MTVSDVDIDPELDQLDTDEAEDEVFHSDADEQGVDEADTVDGTACWQRPDDDDARDDGPFGAEDGVDDADLVNDDEPGERAETEADLPVDAEASGAMADPPYRHADTDAELDHIIADRLVTMMYQPITSLLDDSIVGYEALARGPEDSPLSTPAAMFRVAEEQGRIKELDLLCQAQAVVQAKDVLLKSGHALFVNVEPSVLVEAALGRDPEAAEQISSLLANVTSACPVVLEVSDRHAYASRAELLAVTIWVRAQGFRVALDDVDVQSPSLSMLPLIEPDVIKLARGVLSASPNADLGLLLSAVRAQSERTGAAVVCQGIESDADHKLALSYGATHAQGFAIGHPEELSDAPIRIRSLEPVAASWGEPCSSPFELVANSSQLRTGSEDLILALTLDLERQAQRHADACILSSFERNVTAPCEIGGRYEELSEVVDFAVALGDDLGARKGVFHGAVGPSEALSAERAIVVLTPQFSAALLARLAGGNERDRQYAFALIYDRGQVTRAARMLMSHIDIDND